MLQRAMVVVLLGCLGLTAGVAVGTLFPSSSRNFSVMHVVKGRCYQQGKLIPSNDFGAKVMPPVLMGHEPRRSVVTRKALSPGVRVVAPAGGCLFALPVRVSDSGHPMGGYVLLGLLAGLSAALGFLVPPRSRLTRR